MNIRQAGQEDAAGIHALEKLIFPDPWTKEQIAFEIQNQPVSIVKVLVNANRIYGYIFVHFVGQEIQILNIAVHPAVRKKGWGTILLENMLQLADRDTDIFLEVRSSNRAAISVYEKIGFQSFDCRKAYYQDGEDAIVMRKHI